MYKAPAEMKWALSDTLEFLHTWTKHHEMKHVWGVSRAGLWVLVAAPLDTGAPLHISALPDPWSAELVGKKL